MVIIKVLVKPRSNKSEVLSFDGEILTVKISAIPYKGQSNIELIKTLSKFFGVPKNGIMIKKGLKSKIKEVVFDEKQKIITGIKKLL